MFGGVRPSVRPSVRLSVCPSVRLSVRLRTLIECSYQGAFKMVGRSKWLLFRQVAPSWSSTLLMAIKYCIT